MAVQGLVPELPLMVSGTSPDFYYWCVQLVPGSSGPRHSKINLLDEVEAQRNYQGGNYCSRAGPFYSKGSIFTRTRLHCNDWPYKAENFRVSSFEDFLIFDTYDTHVEWEITFNLFQLIKVYNLQLFIWFFLSRLFPCSKIQHGCQTLSQSLAAHLLSQKIFLFFFVVSVVLFTITFTFAFLDFGLLADSRLVCGRSECLHYKFD